MLHAGDGAVNDVIGEEDGKGFVAHQVLGHQDGVALAQGRFLTNVADVGQVRDLAHLRERAVVAFLAQEILQLKGNVKVILDGPLPPARDDDDLLNTRGHGLLDHVLNDGLIYQRQHLFGLRLGGGQESRSQPGGGENGLADLHGKLPSGESGNQ